MKRALDIFTLAKKSDFVNTRVFTDVNERPLPILSYFIVL